MNSMKLIDLSHTFRANMPAYPTDEAPAITQTSFMEKEGYVCYRVETGMHAGTHMDSPMHFFPDGQKICDISLDLLFGRGHLIDARGKTEINSSFLENQSIEEGDIVLIFTGFDKHFGEEKYYKNYPTLTKDCAEKIIELGVKMIGSDTPSPDYPPFDAHKILLSKGVLILENLTNLETLLGIRDFEIIALPPKFETEAAPARIVARV